MENAKEVVAEVLNGLTVDQVGKVAKKFLGEDIASNYSHLNPGQQRMCIGNKIKGALVRGDGKITALKAAVKEVAPKTKRGKK